MKKILDLKLLFFFLEKSKDKILLKTKCVMNGTLIYISEYFLFFFGSKILRKFFIYAYIGHSVKALITNDSFRNLD